MTLKEKDFIEIEFTGKIKDGDVFDSNIKEDIDKAGLKTPPEPFTFAIGQGMFLKGIDDFLIGKEVGKQYDINLEAKDAFGERRPDLIRLMPMNVFRQHKINPIPGVMLNFDGRPARILSVSGGRVRVDFNNPLAGKDVNYKVKVLKKLDKIEDKINALNNFLFRKKFKFDIKDNTLTLNVDKQFLNFVKLFKEKFKDMLGLDLEVTEVEEKAKAEPKE